MIDFNYPVTWYKLAENEYINLNSITKVTWDEPLDGKIYMVIRLTNGERHFDRPESEIKKILEDIGINLETNLGGK